MGGLCQGKLRCWGFCSFPPSLNDSFPLPCGASAVIGQVASRTKGKREVRERSEPKHRDEYAVTQGRDSKGRLIKGNVPWNKRADSSPPAIASRMLIGGGAVKTDCVQVTCPACRQKVEAIARNGRVKGHCAVAMRYVDFRV